MIEIFIRMLEKFEISCKCFQNASAGRHPCPINFTSKVEKKYEGKQVGDLAAFQETSSHSAYCSDPAQVQHHDISSTFARKRTHK
jgi:hypothetical protein